MATPKRAQADLLLRRMEERATLLAPGDDWTVVPPEYQQPTRDGYPMRWKLGARWIEFSCGCTAERCMALVDVKRYDPVIFRGLPEQAVYVKCCDFHGPSMNKRLGFGGFRDFGQWYRARYRRLTQRAGAR